MTEKLNGWLETAIQMAPNLLIAALVLAASIYAARFLSRWVERALLRFTDNSAIAGLLAAVGRVGVIAGGVFVALDVLHLEKTVTSLLAGLGVVGLALGFAFKDIAANFMSGALLAFRGPFQTGDIIEVDGKIGTVESLQLRRTVLRTFDGLNVILPNREVFEQTIVNYTRTNERRVEVAVGVSYSDPLDEVLEVLPPALEDIEGRDPKREVEVLFTGFGESSIDFVVRLWLARPDQREYLRARSEIVIRTSKALTRAGLTIPFPIRTLDLGDRGELPIAMEAGRGKPRIVDANEDDARDSASEGEGDAAQAS
nr:mechanosensitive ion channel family protein [Pseudenhygromyxa sp. WMMC2535]